ncbi:hypothetical protein [Acinetobacter stercoris]|uniref:CheW-like domain-containing protein n=1 Tax=Acinetobacter stercoris TaxID=2126983 RepID=A0A2U3N1V6_9GAMM|nr:hypothetical protein [Acinetobacter stercoris]SPL71624.1 hypothetical protein KPC_2802 [Acinetobacter stercoris]
MSLYRSTPENEKKDQFLDQSLTVSTGVIDAYIIECFDGVAMLLPQNIVLSAIDCETVESYVTWHEDQLPVYAVNDPQIQQGIALIIEGEGIAQRFAIMCTSMPRTVRLRISELTDDHRENTNPFVYQYVVFENRLFYIPDLNEIFNSLQKKESI